MIEVGVDVPNASIMVIENAERLGLSQLHQLRGRVGRGATASFAPYSIKLHCHHRMTGTPFHFTESNDGFVIAEKDLEIRGPVSCWAPNRQGIWALRGASGT